MELTKKTNRKALMSCLKTYKKSARDQFSWTELSPSGMAERLFILLNLLMENKKTNNPQGVTSTSH